MHISLKDPDYSSDHLPSQHMWAANFHYTGTSRVIACKGSERRMRRLHSTDRRISAYARGRKQYKSICVNSEQIATFLLFRFGWYECAGAMYLQYTALTYCIYSIFFLLAALQCGDVLKRSENTYVVSIAIHVIRFSNVKDKVVGVSFQSDDVLLWSYAWIGVSCGHTM